MIIECVEIRSEEPDELWKAFEAMVLRAQGTGDAWVIQIGSDTAARIVVYPWDTTATAQARYQLFVKERREVFDHDHSKILPFQV